MDANKKLTDSITGLTEVLVAINVATPIVGATITGIVMLIKAAVGDKADLSELADKLEAKLDRNDVAIRAELERLRGLSQ